MISQGYLIAEELGDGSPGRPVGNDDGSVALFDDLEAANKVLDAVAVDGPDQPAMHVFRVNISIAGKVVRP